MIALNKWYAVLSADFQFPVILIYIYICIYTQGVPGGKDLTSGECFLGQTIPI